MTPQTTPPSRRSTRSRAILRAMVLLMGLLIPQFVLYGPSLIGRTILLPLELLEDPGTQGGTAESGRSRPHDRLLSDPITQIEPMRRFAVSEIRAGRLPVWDPYNYCGAPFLAANQGGVFSPYRLLDYVWPDPMALAWGQMLRAVVGGIGAYFFFRRSMRAHVWAAMIGAWIWPQSGFLVLWTMWPQSAAASWLPWLMWAVDRGVRRPSGEAVCLVAIFSAFTMVSGHSATGAHVLLASGLYALWALWRWRHLGFLARGATVAAGWLIGGMLAAPQLLPTLEYMGESVRMVNRLAAGSETLPVGWAAIPQLLFPWIAGTTRAGWIYLNSDIPLDSAIGGYAGAIGVLVFAPFALTSSTRRGQAIFWIVLALLGCAYIINLPGAWSMHRLPGLAMLRPNRFVLATGFALLSLLVCGMDVVLRNQVTGSRAAMLGPVLAIGVMAWCLWRGWTIADSISGQVAPTMAAAGQSALSGTIQVVQGLIERFQQLCLVYAALCLAAAVCGWVLAWRRSGGLAIAIGIAGVIEVTLSAYGVNPQAERASYDWRMSALEAVASAEPGRICGVRCLPPMMPRWFGLSDVRGYDAVDPKHYIQVMDILASPDSPPPDSVAATFAFLPRLPSKLGDFMNLRYFVVRGQPSTPSIARFITPGYFVIENTDALPRATVPRGVMAVATDAESLAALRDPAFDPKETVILNDQAAAPSGPIEGSARIVEELPARVAIEYDMKTDGYVVLADRWDAGWRAAVNDAPAQVLRANHAFRAVFVKAGKGRLVMSYWPMSLTWGFLLCGSGVLAIAIIAGWPAWRRRIMRA